MYMNRIISLAMICGLLASSNFCWAKQNVMYCKEDLYAMQLDLGGYYFNKSPHTAEFIRGFVPIAKSPQQVIYGDARYLRSNTHNAFEGNIGVGMRQLFDNDQQMWGVSLYLDRIRTINHTFFSKMSAGTEYWLKNYYLGANFYMPVGARSALDSSSSSYSFGFDSLGNIIAIQQNQKLYDVSMIGGDIEAGYQFNYNFTTYLGTFYYHSSTSLVSTPIVLGPFIKSRYSIFPRKKFINEASLDAQLQYDKSRNVIFSLSIRLTLAGNRCNLSKMQQHMVDPILRTIDLIELNQSSTSITEFIIIPN